MRGERGSDNAQQLSNAARQFARSFNRQKWRPDYFAAAIPICGGGDPAQAAKLKNLPIRAFHGDQDTRVPYRRTTEMIEAIRQVGGHPKMTIFPNVGHDSWGLAYGDPAVLAWLFAQKK